MVRYRGDVIVLLCYLLAAVYVTGGWWRDPAGVLPVENTSDPAFFEWAFGHAARIFTAGENPLFSPTLNAPLGVNMMANTGMLGVTVPLVPVTVLFGPAVSLVLSVTVGLAGTAGAWYLVLRRYLPDSRAAAIVGGVFGGFAPAMINHANAHPNLICQFLVPVILWRALRIGAPVADQVPVPAWVLVRRGIPLGLLVVWQCLINEELLFLYACAAAVFVALYLARRPAAVRGVLGRYAAGLAVAAGTALVVLAYPLWFQFTGPGHYRGLPEFILGYGTDLAAYPAFPKLSLGAGDGTIGPLPEENTFFGWPLLLLLAVIVLWLWRHPVVTALAGTAVVVAVLSLGATAQYRHETVIGHAPWGLLNSLPLFDSVVPIRWGLVLVPALGVLLALSVRALTPGPGRRGLAADPWYQVAWLALVALVLVPLFPVRLPVQPRQPVPVFFTRGDWRDYVRPGESVVNADATVWFGGITAMHWGTATDQGVRVVGGYFLGPDVTGVGWYGPLTRPTAGLLAGVAGGGPVPEVTAAQRDQARRDFAFWRAAIVVLAAGAPNAEHLRATLDRLIGPGQVVDDVLIWAVRDR